MADQIRITLFVMLWASGFFRVPSAWAFDYSLLPPTNGLRSDFTERRAGKEVNASIRLGVSEEGIYRVTYSSLTNSGESSSNLVGALMRLFCRTQEVAILVSNTNQWTASDYFLFPGVGYDGYYSMTNVYWLGFGSGGKRMTTRPAVPQDGIPLVVSHRKTVVHHVDRYYSDTYRADDDSVDHWADNVGSAYSQPASFDLITDRIDTHDPSVFRAVMLGFTSDDAIAPDHNTRVMINGSPVGQFSYDGFMTAQLSTNFPSSLLQATNSLSFQQTINSLDQALLERFSVTYSRMLYQEGGGLFFDGRPGTNMFRITGFSSSNTILVFDVTDPAAAVILSGAPTNLGDGVYAQQFADSNSQTARYSVVSDSGLKDVGSVQRVFFRDLALTNRMADYLVICPYDFRAQVYRLLALRYSQGLSVAVAPLPDLYNEFSYGIADAAAIKQFIGYAFHHWKSPPKYILLAGNGTYDPRHNETSSTVKDLIPVHLGPGYALWTALDGWYVAVNGSDNLPDIALGRIPVQTSDQLKHVVDKIICFEGVSSNHYSRAMALLASDQSETNLDFRGASERVRMNDLPDFPFIVNTAYQPDPGKDASYIVGEINDGRFLVNYFGHGDSTEWATPVLFSASNIASLTNTYYPVISMLTCENGAFHGTGSRCLATALLESNHGAVACVAASGLSTLIGSESLSHGLYQVLFKDRKKRIGDTLLPAYAALYLGSKNTRELLFFELFGDPAMMVNP